MIRTYIACDICKQPIPVETVIDDDGHYENILMNARTKEWDTKELFPDLCECCAAHIDKALFKMKSEITTQQAVMANNKKLNNERKEKLGTNG